MKISEIKNILSELRTVYEDARLFKVIDKLVEDYGLPETISYNSDLLNIFDYWLDNIELKQQNDKLLNKQNLNTIIAELRNFSKVDEYMDEFDLVHARTWTDDTLNVLSHIINNMEEVSASNVTIICLHS